LDTIAECPVGIRNVWRPGILFWTEGSHTSKELFYPKYHNTCGETVSISVLRGQAGVYLLLE
jgi:hypothetical protein